MAEYIERDALEGAFDAATMAFLEKEDHLFDAKSVLAGMSVAAGIVHTVPAADVAPVVHGRWIRVKWVPCDDPDGGYWVVRCDQCSIPHIKEYRFCPSCGAKMDKEEPNGR